jgi:hypothetical protein
MKRIWTVRIAAYQPRPFSVRSPNFAVASFFTRARDDHVADDEQDEHPEGDERVETIAVFCTSDTRITTSMSGISSSPACHPASTKSRTNGAADRGREREVLLLAVGHADARFLALRREVGLRAGARLLRVGTRGACGRPPARHASASDGASRAGVGCGVGSGRGLGHG